MQLGEGTLEDSCINRAKAFDHPSEDTDINGRDSSRPSFQNTNWTSAELKVEKFSSSIKMLGDGQSDALLVPKGAVEERKGALTSEEGETCDNRHAIDGVIPDRYFISSSHQTQDMNPCSLFPYPSQAGAIYPGSDGPRYSASLHYSSVLPSAGFSSPVCSSRGQCGSSYQFSQGPGCIYPSYQGSGSGLSPMQLPGTAAGSRAQVYLCNRPLWLKFHRHQTEMIITKQGRRMFPFLSFNITGLRLNSHYNVFVEVVLADPNHWRFQGGKWVTCGKADNNMQGNKVYIHPESPNTGAHWMRQEISFGKLKLTNNKGTNTSTSQMIVLQSLHKYQPRLHIVEVSEDGTEEMSREAKTQTFTFPENQFIAVTAYQNTDITQLKIDHNPFAKGFRDNYDSMYTAPEGERLTPSPTGSPRAHQIVPGAHYAMQPFLQEQLVSSQGRFYGSERAVPQSNSSMLSPQAEEAAAAAAPAQRWFVGPMQQPSGSKLDLTPYEGDYSTGGLLPYGLKPLPLPPATHSFGYYPESAFASVAASSGWASRGSYARKMAATGLPWSPKPSSTGSFPDDQVCEKEKSREEGPAGAQTPAWMDTPSPLKALDSGDPGLYLEGCKRRRLAAGETSEDGSTVTGKEGNLSIGHPAGREATSKSMAYYAFYTSP